MGEGKLCAVESALMRCRFSLMFLIISVHDEVLFVAQFGIFVMFTMCRVHLGFISYLLRSLHSDWGTASSWEG